MNKENSSTYPQPERWSFLWLVTGCVLAIFLGREDEQRKSKE